MKYALGIGKKKMKKEERREKFQKNGKDLCSAYQHFLIDKIFKTSHQISISTMRSYVVHRIDGYVKRQQMPDQVIVAAQCCPVYQHATVLYMKKAKYNLKN